MLVECGCFAGKMCSNAWFRCAIIRIGKNKSVEDLKQYRLKQYRLKQLKLKRNGIKYFILIKVK